MSPRSTRVMLGIGAVVLAAGGAVAGAAIYSSYDTASTTTVVERTVTVDHAEPVSATTGLTINDIYRKTHKGVVDITDTIQQQSFGFRGGSASAEGSGFVYDKSGDIITNDHVVSGASQISVKLWNGRTFKAHVVGTDPSTDLAVIKISAPPSLLVPLPLVNSNDVQVGDGVVAIGSPFGYAQSVTSGIVSALHRQMTSPSNYVIDDSIQTDAPINHGNSGGPLLDSLGRVIGINAQIQSTSGDNAGVGFAIPSNTIKPVVAQLAAGNDAQHAYIGVSIENSATSVPGAEISSVEPGTPSWAAKLTCGDVITKVGDTTVGNSNDLTSILQEHAPGDVVTVTYSRGGKSHTTTVTLGNRPSAAANIPTPVCSLPAATG